MSRSAVLGACALSMLSVPSLAAAAASDAEVAELRKAIVQMRKDYEARIGALERRLAAAELRSAPAQARPAAQPARATNAQSAAAASPPPETAPVATAEPATAAPAATGRAAASAFNPAISLILEGTAANYSRDRKGWRIPGVQIGGHAGLPPEGLSIGHTELVVSANVDDWFYGQATIALHDDEDGAEVEIEEAFVDTLSLPAGFGLRLGRFLPQVGYLNVRHPHTWDFVDAPLPNQAFLGSQWYDDGARLSWVAPTALYVELGVETLQGGQYPVAGDNDGFLGGAQNYYVKLGGDIGSSSWQAGLSHLRAEPADRESGDGHDHGEDGHETFAFTGDSALTVADLVWKWAPDGNARERNAKLQAEYFYRHEDGRMDFSNATGGALLPYDGHQQGFYVQGVYQFIPRWRAGLRYDRVWSDNDLAVTENTSGEAADDVLRESGLPDDGHDPHRYSVMVDYSHSEFSRLRLQYTRDYTLPEADDQFFLQYVMSLGAHGAHAF